MVHTEPSLVVDYKDRTGTVSCPGEGDWFTQGVFCFFSLLFFSLRLIQASLALVAVFRPQAPKASRIIDLKV